MGPRAHAPRAARHAPLYELITRQEPGDIAHEMVNLVSYMLALFFVNQEAHSLFWFFFYLNVHPLITSVLDALSECMPCLWDEFVFKTFLAGLNTVVFCYFASSTVRGDDGERAGEPCRAADRFRLGDHATGRGVAVGLQCHRCAERAERCYVGTC